MILERLVLENYKQFREWVELSPPEGAIGVVGRNGAGKTTLFESILWAFFGSRGRDPRFSNDSIPWSGGTTAEKTTVEVTLNVGGTPYKVTRTLQRGKTEARVYSDAEEIVAGSEVAEWVQENLLGMDRTAFEATFFARQKELEFFAGVTGVERQREIARILGINQVEEAQKLLRADRKEAQNEVKFVEAQLEGVDRDRLAQELQQAREEHVLLEREAARLRGECEAREAELAAVRAEGERLEEAYRRHNELRGDLAAAESVRKLAAQREAELREKLAALDADEEAVKELRPQTEGLAGVVAEIGELEEACSRHERRERAVKDLNRRLAEASEALTSASGLLEKLDDSWNGSGEEPLVGWRGLFTLKDEVEQVRRAREVLGEADVAHGNAKRRLRALAEIKDRHEELGRAEEECEKLIKERDEARAELAEVEDEESGFVGREDPDARVLRLRQEEVRLRRRSAEEKGIAETNTREADRLDEARRIVEEAESDAECPTCHRGFEDSEYLEVVETLNRQAADLHRRAAQARTVCEDLEEEADCVAEELREAERLRKRVLVLQKERAVVSARLETSEDRLRDVRARIEALWDALEGKPPPTETAVQEVESFVERLEMLKDARPRIEGFVEAYENSLGSTHELAKEIEDLKTGPPYDPARHEELLARRTELERLLGKIENLEARLRTRPEVEERLKTAGEEEKEAARRVDTLRKELDALAFDEGAYLASRERVAAAEKAREELRGRLEELAERLRKVEGRVEGLEGEISRYEKQRRLADEKAAEATKLAEMDKLLSEFYRELTARVRPRLQDEASNLVKTLTDGRYEKVEFDQNYGVRLYDGLSDAYEISRFSGGEADVVSLSARVALSKMISAKGSEALGFIVLDEVFGALDTERRRNVLLALDRLKKAFGQIFIISHVGDVQESALLDELWMVEEDEEGKSTVRRQKFDLGEPVELLEGVRGS